MKNNEVIIVRYDKENQIEHIGITSIEEIRAKPVIDILIGVDSLATLDNKTFFKDLQNAGFYRIKVSCRQNADIIC